MTAQALSLPSLSAELAAARRALGRGAGLDFEVAGDAGYLEILPGDGPSGGSPVTLECAHGPLTLSEPGAVLSLFGECPVSLPTDAGADDDWFWALFQQSLAEALKETFGYLRPVPGDAAHGIECRLQVRLGGAFVVSRLALSPASLLSLLGAPAWRRHLAELPEAWPLHAPVLLGSLSLTATQLRGLRAGDLLLPEQPWFDPFGQGRIRLGRHLLTVTAEAHATTLQLTVLALEETDMEHSPDTDLTPRDWDNSPRYDDENGYADPTGQRTEEQVMDADEAGAAMAGERFDDLPLALTVRCGRLRLSLGELRQLAPGSVLEVDGATPGAAALFYGERAVAHGELVEVEGRLGLQVTRVDIGG